MRSDLYVRTGEIGRAGDWTATIELQHRCEQFLFEEAASLDSWRLPNWLAMLDPAIDYRIPVRNTLMHDQPGEQYSTTAFHMVEDLGSLTVRAKRFDGSAAWSERPRSRMRRHVSNIRVFQDDQTLRVTSNLLLFWSRDTDEYLLSCRRDDELRDGGEAGLRLLKRTVFLDHDLLPLPNLSLPL